MEISRRKPKASIAEVRIHPVLQQYLGYCLGKAGAIMRRNLNVAFAEYGVEAKHFAVLRVLGDSNQPNQLAIGLDMGVDKATMVKLIDDLEAKGLVERIVDPADRRAKLITISRRGRGLAKTLESVRDSVESDFLRGLSLREKHTLRKTLTKLVGAL
ncbi:MAG: MarR family transcriptional regulator [Pseudomonadota bacterium]